jgi:hypothetical protein
MTARNERLEGISKLLDSLEAHADAIQKLLTGLEAEGMYPAIPTESFQKRNGSDTNYLYMMFGRSRRTGLYEGPEGKRKLYVGCKPNAIETARQLVENRRLFDQLTAHRKQIYWKIERTDSDLANIHRTLDHYTLIDLSQYQNRVSTIQIE